MCSASLHPGGPLCGCGAERSCVCVVPAVVFLDLPLLFAPDAMLKKGGLPFQFDKTRGMRFGVLDRYAADASGIKWFTGPPGMIFHVANAWEADDNRLEVYACVFDNFSLEQFTAVSDDSEPHLSRI